jgi:hypothetical protein
MPANRAHLAGVDCRIPVVQLAINCAQLGAIVLMDPSALPIDAPCGKDGLPVAVVCCAQVLGKPALRSYLDSFVGVAIDVGDRVAACKLVEGVKGLFAS